MTATLQQEQHAALEAVDHGLASWQSTLEDAAQQGALDPELRTRLTGTLRRLITAANDGIVPPLDAETANEIRRRLLTLATIDADDRPPLDVADEAMIEAEAVRHIVRDVLDGRPPTGARTRDQIAQLEGWLPSVPIIDLARLLGVDRRTVTRMRSDDGPPTPRLELVWRLVAVLHRSWTDAGVVAWFHRPRAELDGRAPVDVLDDRAREQDLTDLARRGRTQRSS